MATEQLSLSLIQAGLTTRFIGRKVIYFKRLTSTMEAARREARKHQPEGTVILAGEQTAGRGRLKRAWISPGGNIALSLILYPEAAYLPYLVMIASLAAAVAIEGTTGLKTQIKWPNDILIAGKKAAGILIENEVKGGQVASAVVGIGINVALRPESISEIAATATSLEVELKRPVPREAIISRLLAEFERLYAKLPDGKAIFKAWRDRLATLGQPVTATWGPKKIAGIAETVDETGALVIRNADGTLTKVVAGDVTLGEIF